MRASPLAAELLAVKFGLELAVERRLGIVVIETDCLEAVRMVNTRRSSVLQQKE